MKVFSKARFIADMQNIVDTSKSKWIDVCDGKTAEEMARLGCYASPDWMVEDSNSKPTGTAMQTTTTMEFKPIKWDRALVDVYTASAPFGLLLNVRSVKGAWHWDIGDAYVGYSKGKCKTMESAMKSCERAYHKYVTDNLARC